MRSIGNPSSRREPNILCANATAGNARINKTSACRRFALAGSRVSQTRGAAVVDGIVILEAITNPMTRKVRHTALVCVFGTVLLSRAVGVITAH